MSLDPSRLDGPDFLDHVAEAELANGNLVNAQIYRERAREWRAHRQQLDDAHARLAAAELRLQRLRAVVSEATA